MQGSGTLSRLSNKLIASDWSVLVVLLIAALAVRLIGIDWGYLHGDERINDAAKVLSGQIVPDAHYYPPLFNYINAVLFGALYAVGRLIPIWYSTAEFRAVYFEDPLIFYLTARAGTAFMAALCAPLFYAFGRVSGLARGPSFLIGLMGVLLPVSILLSHIAKSDVPLATSAAALIVVITWRQRTLKIRRADLLLGLTVVLGLSFKQSFVILAAPLLLSHGLLLLTNEGIARMLRSAIWTIAVCVILWPLLNVGILLDLDGFVAYQKIQSVMSLRDDNFGQSVAVWWSMISSPTQGITLIGAALFLIYPLILVASGIEGRLKATLCLCWISVILAMLATIQLTGTRQQEGLWIPAFTAAQMFAGLCVGLLISHGRDWVRWGASAAAVAALALAGFGTFIISSQALAPPVSAELARMVESEYRTDKTLTTVDINMLAHPDAARFTRNRDERLALKYDVVLPEQAAERQDQHSGENGIFILRKPIFLWGLEGTTDEDLKGIVKPYAWPPQAEEWTLGYWLDLGFGIHIISDLEFHTSDALNDTVTRYYRELEQRCSIARIYDPAKPLFLESTVHIFDCRDQLT